MPADDPAYGCQTMTAPLRRVLMRCPGPSLRAARAEDWHYGMGFDAARAIEQYAVFAGLIAEAGAEIAWLADEGDGLADAMFTHDPSLVTGHGAILLRMGKARRAAEPALHGAFYRASAMPLVGKIEAPGQVEGGDCVWVDERTLAVGRGVRSNEAGIRQLQRLLSPFDVTVLGFDLPLWQGFEACLHLMSIISPLADRLALVHPPLFPVAFWQLLAERGYRLLEAPADEFRASHGLSLNVLPTAPGEVIMVDGFPATRRLMESAGCTVRTFAADALCIACEGGPTCLTRPILRAGP
jgi:N-dimethylarginine dimethylaminohydrolase